MNRRTGCRCVRHGEGIRYVSRRLCWNAVVVLSPFAATGLEATNGARHRVIVEIAIHYGPTVTVKVFVLPSQVNVVELEPATIGISKLFQFRTVESRCNGFLMDDATIADHPWNPTDKNIDFPVPESRGSDLHFNRECASRCDMAQIAATRKHIQPSAGVGPCLRQNICAVDGSAVSRSAISRIGPAR